MNEEQWACLQEWTSIAVQEVALDTKSRQKQKCDQVMKEKFSLEPALDTKKVVKNLSKQELNPAEEQALVLGLNFAVTPQADPCYRIWSLVPRWVWILHQNVNK